MKKKLLYLMLFLVLTVGGFFISPEQILADDVFPTSIKVEDIKKYQASVTNDSGNDIFLDVLKDVSEWNFGGGKLYIYIFA